MKLWWHLCCYCRAERPSSSLKSWGQMKGGEVNGSVRFGTKIRQSIVIATFAAFVSLTSKLYLYCTVDKMPTITGTTFALVTAQFTFVNFSVYKVNIL